MAYVFDCALLLACALASSALKFVSQTIRLSSVIHKVVKKLDRGKTKLPPGLPLVSPWEIVSDLVVRINGLNPGMHTLQGTNCYLVGKGKKRILVDTGESVDGFIDLLLDVMRKVGCEGLDAILLTHWHTDHVGGVIDVLQALNGQSIPVFKRTGPKAEAFDYEGIEDGQLFRTDGATLEALHTPGHTEDHVSFLLREEEALMTGDMILGCGSAIFDDFESYMASLRRVLAISSARDGGFTRLYCGHGPVVDKAEEKIAFYIAHRQQREDQIMKTLTAAAGSTLSSFQITLQVYGFLAIPLLVSAHYNVLHHLSKLVSEGRAEGGITPCSFRLSPPLRPNRATKPRGSRN
ncbi:unnamed protein product [Laminaria digitata]